MTRKHFHIGFVIIALLAAPFVGQHRVQAEDPDNNSVRLLGVGEIAGTAIDLSGLSETLTPVEGTSSDFVPEGREFSNDMLGGISAIAWTGVGNDYWMLPDRGPLDGAVDWTCRLQKVRLSIDSGSAALKTKLLETVILRDKRGIPFTGAASAFEESSTMTRRLDPEGIRVAGNGNVFISDEYGPRVLEFSTNGQLIQELEVPERYLVSQPDVSKKTENPKNVSGRATNRGMEGLAVSSDGVHLFGLMQSPLLQDSFRESMSQKPAGLNCRMPCFDTQGNFGCEFVYQLDSESNKLNEILCCDSANQFVTIERDGEAGPDAKFKKLMLISSESASDVSGIESLPRKKLPPKVQPVSKSVLVDLLDKRWGLCGDRMPEKIEGIAFGPNLGDYRLLIVASDNDFVPDQPTMIYAFAVHQSVFRQMER